MWRTEPVERKKPSVGMPVSSARIWSARAGSVTDWPSYWRSTVPLDPANVFSSVPERVPSSSSWSNSIATTVWAPSAASHGRSDSRSPAALVTRRVMASSMARWMVDLPASFGPRTIVRPGARSMSSSR